ncbi:hypothetical protein CSUI_000893 [Cystoisospora suis]|uniref:Uncharacterized protein n=1 Tax=Cystoisospora suis TaxID=483139 RepID=A0A2C6LEQ9_9APIC|nr:hypothetical protein CSUI_000893 [Cystoisospora suis]
MRQGEEPSKQCEAFQKPGAHQAPKPLRGATLRVTGRVKALAEIMGLLKSLQAILLTGRVPEVYLLFGHSAARPREAFLLSLPTKEFPTLATSRRSPVRSPHECPSVASPTRHPSRICPAHRTSEEERTAAVHPPPRHAKQSLAAVAYLQNSPSEPHPGLPAQEPKLLDCDAEIRRSVVVQLLRMSSWFLGTRKETGPFSLDAEPAVAAAREHSTHLCFAQDGCSPRLLDQAPATLLSYVDRRWSRSTQRPQLILIPGY